MAGAGAVHSATGEAPRPHENGGRKGQAWQVCSSRARKSPVSSSLRQGTLRGPPGAIALGLADSPDRRPALGWWSLAAASASARIFQQIFSPGSHPPRRFFPICYLSNTLCYPIHSRDTHLFQIMKKSGTAKTWFPVIFQSPGSPRVPWSFGHLGAVVCGPLVAGPLVPGPAVLGPLPSPFFRACRARPLRLHRHESPQRWQGVHRPDHRGSRLPDASSGRESISAQPPGSGNRQSPHVHRARRHKFSTIPVFQHSALVIHHHSSVPIFHYSRWLHSH